MPKRSCQNRKTTTFSWLLIFQVSSLGFRALASRENTHWLTIDESRCLAEVGCSIGQKVLTRNPFSADGAGGGFPADVVPGTSRFPRVLESGRFRLAGLSVGPLPEVLRRSTGLVGDPEAADAGNGSDEHTWFEGDFDPFTVWLDGGGSSQEAGAHLRHDTCSSWQTVWMDAA